MKKRYSVLLSSVLAATVLAACGNDNNDNATPVNEGNNNEGNNNVENNVDNADNNNDNNEGNEATGDGEGFSSKMVTDVGGVDDRSFNESAWAGLTMFGEDYPGAEVDYLQSSDSSDYAPNLNRLARDGTDITFGIGFLMEDEIRDVAGQNPDQNFAIVDTVVTDEDGNMIDNVANITFAEHEGSFLVGVIAAMHTETNEVGFIGGVESELIKKFESGFKAGVHSVDPDIEIATQYAQDFNDASLGQQIADGMYAGGADIIYHAAGGTGNGLFTEAIDRRESGEEVWAIGVDQDQALTEGEWSEGNVILTSMVKRVDQSVYQVSEDTMNGNFPGGEVLEFALEDEGVGFAETRDNVSDEAIEAANDYRDQIINGDIEVPQTDDEYDEWYDSL
ncbi:BMP family lipoprotein [Salisediminibacterium beveridgei]|uniref:Unspecified monosaccharide ABC transport system, substrate-binding component n=1 Tax=Salisediminibacterium beveridgei TaxID=632773 RepID=A0A1D7QWS0_9BACI|nr:BMP family ABC transporter substrate-binding protein [Salisediminibacterium beveridgei]AOM83450.1 Unspecified monosaccharide ABC transport system, substrate-binding component [Salisediminibacterium beveridgei]